MSIIPADKKHNTMQEVQSDSTVRNHGVSSTAAPLRPRGYPTINGPSQPRNDTSRRNRAYSNNQGHTLLL